MFEMFMDSASLFLKGKLFQDYKSVFLKILIGSVCTAVLGIILLKFGIDVKIAVAIAALIGGAAQPYLLKDLKYK